MRSDDERQSRVADEMESRMEDREESRREVEEATTEDLNQGFQTGTYDSRRSGIKWPPSYRRRKGPKTRSSGRQ